MADGLETVGLMGTRDCGFDVCVVCGVRPSSGGGEPAAVARHAGVDRPAVHRQLRARQDGHGVRQRLHARPDHLPLQERATPAHRHQVQVRTAGRDRPRCGPETKKHFVMIIGSCMLGTNNRREMGRLSEIAGRCQLVSRGREVIARDRAGNATHSPALSTWLCIPSTHKTQFAALSQTIVY